MKRVPSLLLLVLVLAAACASERGRPSSAPSPSGPPRVDLEVVEKHAAQFDDDLPERTAGSQEEFAAATYILGTLQQAGYVIRLESIALEGLEKSTTVFAVTAGGEAPEYVVTVPYSSSPSTPNGEAVGLFLELARALRVIAPDHDVAFAALGAEPPRSGGGPGSRSLAIFLTEEEVEPAVIRLQTVESDPDRGGFKAYGGQIANDLNHLLCDLAGIRGCSITLENLVFSPDPLRQAGFDHVLVTGDSEGIGQVLLEYLGEHGR